MKQLLKKTIVAALFVILGANMANAAFPTVKQSNQTTTTKSSAITESALATVALQPATTEVKKAVPPTAKFYGGSKHRYVALILAAACGEFGVHSFYMGQKPKGFLQLAIGAVGLGLYIGGVISAVATTADTVTIPALAIVGLLLFLGAYVWAVIDFFRILSGNLAPEEGFDD